DELPGILLWAITGWQRLRTRNRFSQPDSGKELLGQLEDLTSPIGEFLRECCEVGAEHQAPKKKLFERWQFWCSESGRQAGDAATFGRNLLAAVPGIKQTQPRGDGAGRVPTYTGIRLRGR